MIIFDCTDELDNKIPEGCVECPFVDYDDQGEYDVEYTAFCSLSKDTIGTFNQHDIGCYLSRNVKLTTCPLKEVKSCPLVEEEKASSRIEKVLHGKTPEEQYDYMDSLLHDYGRRFTDSRLAVIDWLSYKEVNK